MVFVRQEAAGDDRREPPSREAENAEDQHGHQGVPHAPAHGGGVPAGEAIEAAVEPAGGEELVARRGFEQQAAKCRAERQSHQSGDRHRNGDGHRKLLIQLAGQAAEEGHRHEDRREHQHDRDDRAGDLLHRFDCGLIRIDVVLFHDPFDVLDDHDCVVDDDADRQHQAEKGQRIDREAERQHAGERADDRDGYGQKRDQRGPPGLEENEHDQQHEHDRFEKGVDHLIDRRHDEFSGVVRDAVVHPRREPAGRVVECLAHALNRAQRVGAVLQVDQHQCRRLAVGPADLVVGLGAKLDPRDILEADDGTVGIGPKDHVFVFLHGLQPSGGKHRQRQFDFVAGRSLADRPGREDGVLLADGRRHIGNGHLPGLEPIGVDPDPHRIIFGPENASVADAFHPSDLIDQVDDRVVAEE